MLADAETPQPDIGTLPSETKESPQKKRGKCRSQRGLRTPGWFTQSTKRSQHDVTENKKVPIKEIIIVIIIIIRCYLIFHIMDWLTYFMYYIAPLYVTQIFNIFYPLKMIIPIWEFKQ